MNKNQVFLVLLTVMMSIFLVALDRTIITTVWRFSHSELISSDQLPRPFPRSQTSSTPSMTSAG
jgi:hypothetical protein